MKLARQSSTPMVIDGDGLFLVTNNIDLVKGYPLAVLTPNVNEYKRLVQKVLDSEVNDQDAAEQLLSLARRIGGTTILRKGKCDLISDGEAVSNVSIYGSPRRCGGQGDILAGSLGDITLLPGVCAPWARQQTSAMRDKSDIRNAMVLGSIAGSVLLRKAASLAFMDKKRATLTTDIIEHLGKRTGGVKSVWSVGGAREQNMGPNLDSAAWELVRRSRKRGIMGVVSSSVASPVGADFLSMKLILVGTWGKPVWVNLEEEKTAKFEQDEELISFVSFPSVNGLNSTSRTH
ncbi:hypothetical protein ACLOJK_011899 [Asimina triloba]